MKPMNRKTRRQNSWAKMLAALRFALPYMEDLAYLHKATAHGCSPPGYGLNFALDNNRGHATLPEKITNIFH